MTITGIITAILIGIVVGVLGRLLVPGKQPIGMLVTILVGIVSAFIGTAIARALGIPTATSGIDWLELLVQVDRRRPRRRPGVVDHGTQAHRGDGQQAVRPVPLTRDPFTEPGGIPWPPGSLIICRPSRHRLFSSTSSRS